MCQLLWKQDWPSASNTVYLKYRNQGVLNRYSKNWLMDQQHVVFVTDPEHLLEGTMEAAFQVYVYNDSMADLRFAAEKNWRR